MIKRSIYLWSFFFFLLTFTTLFFFCIPKKSHKIQYEKILLKKPEKPEKKAIEIRNESEKEIFFEDQYIYLKSDYSILTFKKKPKGFFIEEKLQPVQLIKKTDKEIQKIFAESGFYSFPSHMIFLNNAKLFWYDKDQSDPFFSGSAKTLNGSVKTAYFEANNFTGKFCQK